MFWAFLNLLGTNNLGIPLFYFQSIFFKLPRASYSNINGYHHSIYSILGIILSILQHVEALEILLQGLSGVRRERFRVHEFCLKSGPNLGELSIIHCCPHHAHLVGLSSS